MDGSLAYSVGIDIGTTSVKCCLLDCDGRMLTEKYSVHDALLKHESHLYHEQDAEKIVGVVCTLLKSIDVTLSPDVTVSVTGQMHGIVLWNGSDLVEGKFNCSSLITWMDERVPKKFVESLPRWECGELHVGFGMVTLAWLHATGQISTAWTCCGTIMDMLICYLSQRTNPVIGLQNAYSWGYCSYDGFWTAPAELVPFHLLPKICSSEGVVDLVRRPDCGLRIGAKLLASCGDLQSTVYPLLQPETAVLNVGTSAQLCFGSSTERIAAAPLLTEPFFGGSGKKIIVAASMNGGSAIDLIVRKIVEWASKLSSNGSELQVDYGTLDSILNKATECSSSTVEVKPVFIQERMAERTVSSISGISSSTTVEELLHGTACGVISNLFHLLPPDQLSEDWGIKHIRLTGNAARCYFIHEIMRQCNGRFRVSAATEMNCGAAYGAALHALRYCSGPE